MTPERTEECIAAFHKRYPILSDDIKANITTAHLEQLKHYRMTQYLTWLEACAWCDRSKK